MTFVGRQGRPEGFWSKNQGCKLVGGNRDVGSCVKHGRTHQREDGWYCRLAVFVTRRRMVLVWVGCCLLGIIVGFTVFMPFCVCLPHVFYSLVGTEVVDPTAA